MEPNQGIKTWQWVVTVIVIIILIVLGYYLFKGSTTPVNTTTTPTTDTTADLNEVNRIVVADQYPGNVVLVQTAQLANGGWVVIHKDNAGKPGAIIGSAYSEKGSGPVRVTLTEKTVDGGTYYAALHADDGDRKFDAAKDVALKNTSGDEIVKVFKAMTNITEVKG